ncbi:hypothetical protein C5167_044469 [Papaver somniferum]|uniref:Uncharacterized protein n=1 Tax=Papaver somniferum TaxID=3469 RepID=A0A4Y7L8T3_PAPSO|nr:hypothetical protein C5167_044469 [Papaver somniferum]
MVSLDLLRYEGVSQSTISKFLIAQPRAFIGDADKFKMIVEKVKGMGFDPLLTTFVVAIRGLVGMCEATWKSKVDVYKRWGWSEDQIQTAFRKSPYCMMYSEKKITAIMDFLVNEMGYDSSSIAETPAIFNNSLKERIIPRCSVIRILVSKGLIEETIPLNVLSVMTDTSFSDKYVKPYEQEAPALMKIFQDNVDLGTASGRYYRVSCPSIIDPGETEISFFFNSTCLVYLLLLPDTSLRGFPPGDSYIILKPSW